MPVSVPTVFGPHTLVVAAEDEVTLGGFLTVGDGGGGDFTAISATDPGTGVPFLPDHGLLFPTANSNVLLRRNVLTQTVPVSDLAPHAFPGGSSGSIGDRPTLVTVEPSQAAWWGAVATASFPDGSTNVATVGDLFRAVTGQAGTPSEAEVFAVYPFLKEGVFLNRNERSDWVTPPATPKLLPECTTAPLPPTPPQRPGDDTPAVRAMAFHVGALQAAIERSYPVPAQVQPLRGDVTVAANAYRLDRHLAIRKPRILRLPDADAPEQAAFEMLRMQYPQNAAVFLIPSWGDFPGAGTTCAGGAFCDEHVYGEPIPAFRFDLDVGTTTESSVTGSFVLPVSYPTPSPIQAGRELFFRIGRTDNDSAEPFVSVWRTVDRTESEDGGAATRVVFNEPLPAVPVMTLTTASVVRETSGNPATNTCDGVNFQDGIWRVTLTQGLTKALKADNPQRFSVPIWRTVLVWTDPTDPSVRVVTRVARNKVCTNGAVTTNKVDYPVGSEVLRLCVDEGASKGDLRAGLVTEWTREAWAFMPLTAPDDSRVEGRLHARSAVGEKRPTNDIGGIVQAYNARRAHAEHVVAETLSVGESGVEARLDRAVIFTTTRDATVGTAVVRTPRPDTDPGKGFRSWAVDLQHTKRTTVQEARIESGLGGGVQFEQTANERVGVDRGPAGVPALDVTLASTAGSVATLGPILDQTYTAEDCRIGAVRVSATEAIPPSDTDAFERSRYALVGITGTPTARDPEVDLRVRALDLGVDTQLVRPYFLDPEAFGDDGADAFVYRTAGQPTPVFRSVRLDTYATGATIPNGHVGPFVVPVPGVVRRIEGHIAYTLGPTWTGGTPPAGAALLYHRQGGSALLDGTLRPQHGEDADAALQVYTGLGWRPYGLLVALPPENPAAPGRWPDNTRVVWSGESLRSAASDAPGSMPFSVTAGIVSDIRAGVTTYNKRLTLTDQAEGFGVAFKVGFRDDGGNPARITAGTGILSIAALDSRDDQSASDIYAMGVGVLPGARVLNLVSADVSAAPMRGSRLYWPAGVTTRQLVIRLTLSADFALSGSSRHTFDVQAVVSQ